MGIVIVSVLIGTPFAWYPGELTSRHTEIVHAEAILKTCDDDPVGVDAADVSDGAGMPKSERSVFLFPVLVRRLASMDIEFRAVVAYPKSNRAVAVAQDTDFLVQPFRGENIAVGPQFVCLNTAIIKE